MEMTDHPERCTMGYESTRIYDPIQQREKGRMLMLIHLLIAMITVTVTVYV